MTGITGQASIVIHRSPEEIWDFLVKPKSWRKLYPLRNTEFNTSKGKLKAGSTIQIKIEARGVHNAINIVLADFSRPSKIEWDGTTTYTLFQGFFRPRMTIVGALEFERVEGGTRVTLTQDMFPPDNFLDEAIFEWMKRAFRLRYVFDDTLYLILMSFQLKLEQN